MNVMRVVVEGTLKPDGSLELLKTLELPPGPVRVTVEAIVESTSNAGGIGETLRLIHSQQEARGFTGRTAEEIDAYLKEMRDDKDEEERWREIYAHTSQNSVDPGEFHP